MVYWIIIAIWAVGILVSAYIIRKWETTLMTKVSAAVLWPLTLILYVIYLIHKKTL